MATGIVREPAIDDAPSTDALYEVVGDQIVEKDMSAYALWIGSLLARKLGDFVESQHLGIVIAEMLFILDAERPLKRRPDVAFVSAEKWPFGQPPPPTGDWDLVPDLAVEVVSPNERFSKVIAKMQECLSVGVGEVWIVDPESRLIQDYRGPDELHTFRDTDQLTCDRFPGWSYPVAELLPNPAVELPNDE
jgi:Uma2 family endonuclease